MTLDVRWVPLLTFFLLFVSSGIICAWLFSVMRSEVNAKSENNAKIGPLGATPATLMRVDQIHQRLYPHSRVRLTLRLFAALGLISMIIVARILGIP